MKIENAVQKAEKWLDIKGIEGVAQSEYEGKPCILVLISLPSEHMKKQLPATYYGHLVLLKETGQIDAQ